MTTTAMRQAIIDAFSQIKCVRGIYATYHLEGGLDVVVTYPESIRIGEVLKQLVPLEIELSKQTSTPIDFDYIPASAFSDELKTGYSVLWEPKTSQD